MPYFPNPNGGAPIQADTNPNPAGGSLGYYSDPGYNGPPPGGATSSGGAAPSTSSPTGAQPTVQSGSSQQLAAGINSLLGAIASGNKQAFDEAVRQFNVTSGLEQGKFDESIRQFNQNFAISQSGVTGLYNGQQTQQAQLQAANIANQVAGLTGYYTAPNGLTGGGGAPLAGVTPGTVVRNSQNQFGVVGPGGLVTPGDASNPAIYQAIQAGQGVQTVPDAAFSGAQQQAGVPGASGQGVPTLAAQLQWANLYGNQAPPTAGETTLAAQQQAYAQQMGAITAAANLQANPFRQAQVIGQAGRVLQGLPSAGFQAPTTVAGVGTQGGNTQGGMGYLSQLISDIKSPEANQTTADSFLAQTPTPNKIDSASFLRSTPSTQNLILQAMNERYGIDPADSLKQIQNTLPQFSAPNTMGTIRRG